MAQPGEPGKMPQGDASIQRIQLEYAGNFALIEVKMVIGDWSFHRLSLTQAVFNGPKKKFQPEQRVQSQGQWGMIPEMALPLEQLGHRLVLAMKIIQMVLMPNFNNFFGFGKGQPADQQIIDPRFEVFHRIP